VEYNSVSLLPKFVNAVRTKVEHIDCTWQLNISESKNCNESSPDFSVTVCCGIYASFHTTQLPFRTHNSPVLPDFISVVKIMWNDFTQHWRSFISQNIIVNADFVSHLRKELRIRVLNLLFLYTKKGRQKEISL